MQAQGGLPSGSNAIQGRARWECQWDHLLDTSAAEGLGTDQRWAEVLAFQGVCQLSLGLWRKDQAVVGSQLLAVEGGRWLSARVLALISVFLFSEKLALAGTNRHSFCQMSGFC